MPTNSSRQDILQKIAAASNRRPAFIDTPLECVNSIYKPILPDAITCFCNELEAINGKCILCVDNSDLYSQIEIFLLQRLITSVYCRDSHILHQLQIHGIASSSDTFEFENMQAGITGCDFLIARTGSVLISSGAPSGRQMNVFPPIHIVIANVSQLVDFTQEALDDIPLKYSDTLPSSMTLITGPSRTADIEKTLILGAHGPKEFVVFLCKD